MKDQKQQSSAGASELPASLVRHLQRLAASGYFGKVTISFQNGKACEVRSEEVKKISELEGDGR